LKTRTERAMRMGTLACCLTIVCGVQAAPPADAGRADPQTKTLRRNWQELKKRQLRLLPVPKQIRFTDRKIVVAGPGARDVVVVLANDSERGQIAANEIVSRMKDFGAALQKEIPVLSVPRPGAYNIVIENRWPNTFTRDAQRPAEAKQTGQAYGLYPTATGITLAGQGEIGMMYAAVTLRYLIEQDRGKVILHPATVTDWPDFKHRHLGGLMADYHKHFKSEPRKHLANMKKHVDFLFRMKATGMFRHTLNANRHTSVPGDILDTKNTRRSAKLVNDYAHERGIVTMSAAGVALGRYPKDKDRPGFDKLMYNKSHKAYYSWGRHDLHRIKARNIAEYCKETGFDSTFVHAIDGGGPLDPATWSQRDEATRRKYGDNRIQADVDMFKIYEEELRRYGKEMIIVAYPYSAGYLNPESMRRRLGMPDTPAGRQKAQEVAARHLTWMRGLNANLPPGVRMCVREAGRESLSEFYAAYRGRPMWVYWEVSWGFGLQPLLATSVRSVGSAYSPDRPHEDIMWVNPNSRMFSEHVKVAGAEYTWNTRFPGWRDRAAGYKDSEEEDAEQQAARDILAERAAVGLWGHEAGQHLKELFRHNMSLLLAFNPKKTAKRVPTDRLRGLIQRNREAVQKACRALDAFWPIQKQAKAAGSKIMDDYSYPFFVQFYGMTKAAKAYADFHCRELEVMAGISAGDTARAMQELATGRSALAENVAEHERLLAELKDEPRVITYNNDRRRHWAWVALNEPDFRSLAARFAKIEADKEKLYEQFNIPKWFKDWLEKREIVAVRARDRIVLDGKLSEPSWQTAPPVEHFVANKQLKIMTMPCAARVLYDDTHLYLGTRAVQPLIGKIRETPRGQDQYAFTEEIEFLFVRGDKKSGDLYQFVVDTTGNMFTLRKPSIPEEGKKSDVRGWDCGAKAAVSKGSGEWSMELAVPLEHVGGRSGKPWRVVLVRNRIASLRPRVVESNASSFFGGKSYQTSSRYAPLRFAEKPPKAERSVPSVECLDTSMESRATQTGTGTLLQFGVQLETKRPLCDVTVRAEVLDSKGLRVGGMPIVEKPALPLTWSSATPCEIQLEDEYKGVKLKLITRYKTLDGADQEHTKTYVLGELMSVLDKQDLFSDGLLPGTRGLGVTGYFDVNMPDGDLLSLARGTVEFWVRPTGRKEWDCLFHYGRRGPKTMREAIRSCVTLARHKGGTTNFEIRNHDCERRYVQANLKWRTGRWQHVACVWDLNVNGKARLEMYHNGKRVADKVKRTWKSYDDSAMTTRPETYALQIGSLNSGYCPANAVFDEVRIWNRPRYAEEFTPSKGPAALSDGSLHFSFENTLTGRYRIARKEGTLTAIIGPQGRSAALDWDLVRPARHATAR